MKKLFLDLERYLPSFVSESDIKRQLVRSSKSPLGAISDYLAKLYEHTMSELTARYSPVFLADPEIELILTVPAV